MVYSVFKKHILRSFESALRKVLPFRFDAPKLESERETTSGTCRLSEIGIFLHSQ